MYTCVLRTRCYFPATWVSCCLRRPSPSNMVSRVSRLASTTTCCSPSCRCSRQLGTAMRLTESDDVTMSTLQSNAFSCGREICFWMTSDLHVGLSSRRILVSRFLRLAWKEAGNRPWICSGLVRLWNTTWWVREWRDWSSCWA